MTENEKNAASEQIGLAAPKKEDGRSSESLSLGERYEQAVALVATAPLDAIVQLEKIQHEVARLALFSSNEGLEDLSTKSIPLLALEHFLAMAYAAIPTGPGKIADRKRYLLKSIDLWAAFLHKLESLGEQEVLTSAEQKEFRDLLEYATGNNDEDHTTTNHATLRPPPTLTREEKISRYQAKQQAQQEVERLKSLRERRARLGVSPEEIMDDNDEEALDRNVAMTNLLIRKAEALDEWSQTLRELPMIERMTQMEQEQSHMERHTGGTVPQSREVSSSNKDNRQGPPTAASGLRLTHISLDNAGQLQFRKEEIRSQVFRPGWSQPTMSLEQFADRERTQAIKREQRQKLAESQASQRPRRFDQLVKDGMEDNVDAVDASAAVDRAWDDWKDENPRGSGNKHGDVGDRNF